jgi:transposase-like protein
MATAITAPYFHDDDKAREYLEAVRWPDGPVCPHCKTEGGWTIESKPDTKNKARPGLYKCVSAECGKQFSVTVGTVFERSKIPLSKWLFAAYLLCSSKKGISSHQLHRTLGVTYKTAWFLTHRIRHAMDSNGGLIGQNGGIIEADETYIGRKPGVKKGRGGFGHKNTVLSLVQRDGEVRSTVVTNFSQVKRAFKKHASPDAHLMTDEHKKFRKIGKQFVSHEVVNHSKYEYVRGNVSTNTIEGVFSIFKRGMTGIYQHCGSQHLHRYLAEFDFRYNHRSALGIEDNQRVVDALKGIEGKRLTYRTVG